MATKRPTQYPSRVHAEVAELVAAARRQALKEAVAACYVVMNRTCYPDPVCEVLLEIEKIK